MFNQNGWARSVHFLAAWCLVLPGAVYLLTGARRGHFRADILPGRGALHAGGFAERRLSIEGPVAAPRTFSFADLQQPPAADPNHAPRGRAFDGPA